MILYEFLLESIVREGLDEIRANPTLIEEAFNALNADRVADFSKWLLTDGFGKNLRVFQGYPRRNQTFPCISILADPEEEVEDFVGSDSGFAYIGGDIYTEIKKSVFQSTYIMMIFCDNADEQVMLSNLVKWIILRKRLDIQAWGLREQRISMRNFQPFRTDEQPDFLWGRAVVLTGKKDEAYSHNDSPLITEAEITKVTDVESQTTIYPLT